ncbi:MAG: hypothetical protein RBG13Loki_1731 [Promethearchaeota archaeon CR_4]|nr:MAG: hypothetical protein RBG13Loki_1731 [Candidatus Lokiarchaeota archaeon CR_4]
MFSIQLFLVYGNLFFFFLMLSILNLASVHFLGSLNVQEKNVVFVRYALLYSILAQSSLYLASVFTEFEEKIIPTTIGGHSFVFFILIFIISFLGLNLIFRKNLQAKFFQRLNLCLFIGFQTTFAIYYIILAGISHGVNLPIAYNVLAILETLLVMYPVKVVHQLSMQSRQEKGDLFDSQIGSEELSIRSPQEPKALAIYRLYLGGFVFLFYFELSFLIFNVSYPALALLPSLLFFHLTLFSLSAIDVSLVKIVGDRLIRTIHTISYFNFSICWLLFLLQFNDVSPIVLGLNLFGFITMQFYTNVSLFKTLEGFYPNATEKMKLLKSRIQTAIGLCFYASILLFLQHGISSFNVLGQGVTLSLGLYLLMFIDQGVFKFMVKTTSQKCQALAWVGLQLFLDVSVWSGIVQVLALLPLYIISNLGGVSYLLKMLNSIESVRTRRGKINQILTIASYITLTTWPFFFISMDLVGIFLLCFCSTCISLVLSYLDNYIGAIGERTRKNIQKASSIIVGNVLAGWITFLIGPIIENIFVTFGSALNVCLFLLFSMGIFALFLRPLKRHSAQAVICWYTIFSLGGLILFFITESLLSGIIFILVFLIAYWVIFVASVRQILLRLVRVVFTQFRVLYFTIKNTLLHAYQKLVAFLHTHFRGIWMGICALCGITVSILARIFFTVPILSALPIGLVIFVLGVYLILSNYVREYAEEKTFKIEFLYYAVLYFTTAWALFSFFPWSTFLFLGAILLFGGVLLFFIGREWKQKRIGYKWRFIAISSFVVLFGVTAFLFVGQLASWFIII